MTAKLRSWWQVIKERRSLVTDFVPVRMKVKLLRLWHLKIRKHPFIIMAMLIMIIGLIVFMIAILNFGWYWTGFTGGEQNNYNKYV